MARLTFSWRTLLPGLVLMGVWTGEDAEAASPPTETTAEKAYRSLRKPCDLEINAQGLSAAVNQLREQTGLNFILDRTAVQTDLFQPATGRLGVVAVQITGEFHQVPLGEAVRQMLRSQHLTYAVAGDTVWITTAEQAIERQMEQTLSVDADDRPLADVLRDLARRTGANILLDRRLKQGGSDRVTLHLDEVSLGTAVEVLAEEANLRLVRLDNVLYVTSEERAEKLRKSRLANRPRSEWKMTVDEKGAVHMSGTGPIPMTPPAFFGILGGGLGALGVGGGSPALGGAPPAPLPPPPQAKPEVKKPEVKPAPEKPPAHETKTREKPAAEGLLPQRRQLDSPRRSRSA